jgi:hypothetical protein
MSISTKVNQMHILTLQERDKFLRGLKYPLFGKIIFGFALVIIT